MPVTPPAEIVLLALALAALVSLFFITEVVIFASAAHRPETHVGPAGSSIVVMGLVVGALLGLAHSIGAGLSEPALTVAGMVLVITAVLAYTVGRRLWVGWLATSLLGAGIALQLGVVAGVTVLPGIEPVANFVTQQRCLLREACREGSSQPVWPLPNALRVDRPDPRSQGWR